MRFLGVDYGHRRVGLAVSDPLGMIAHPLEILEVESPEEAARRVADAASEREVGEIVLGLPVGLDESETQKAREVLEWKELLEAETDLPVTTWDERLSTAQAERHLRETGWSQKKRRSRVDMVAAQIILQSFLDARSKRPGTQDEPPPRG